MNDQIIDSADYRMELLSPPPPAGESVLRTREPSWQLKIDDIKLPETQKHSMDLPIFMSNTVIATFPLPIFVPNQASNTVYRYHWRQRKISEYYRRQENLLKGYNQLESYTHLGTLPDKQTQETKQLEKSENIAIYASNVANLVLFIAKMYASVQSRSMAVIASTVDSFLDLLSGFILCFTAHAMKKPNLYKYPVGKDRMQPVGIVVFASVMATLGLQILFESARDLIAKNHPDKDPEKEMWMIGIMISVTVVKFLLTIYCRQFKNEIVKAYAQDHFFDVITNSVGLSTAILAIKFCWWIDPVGAILIALYTIFNWANTVKENVWSLIGKSAPPEYLAKLTYLVWNHDKEIKHIDTVRAYTFGCNYFVEVDIVLPEEMLLNQSHDIGETLQEKLEKLPEIDRAFVHVDFDITHKPEHNPKVA